MPQTKKTNNREMHLFCEQIMVDLSSKARAKKPITKQSDLLKFLARSSEQAVMYRGGTVASQQKFLINVAGKGNEFTDEELEFENEEAIRKHPEETGCGWTVDYISLEAYLELNYGRVGELVAVYQIGSHLDQLNAVGQVRVRRRDGKILVESTSDFEMRFGVRFSVWLEPMTDD